MRVPRAVLAAGVALAFMAGSANAQTVVSDPGTLYNTTALTGYATYSSDMLGMKVTFFDLGGMAYSGFWDDLGLYWGVDLGFASLIHPLAQGDDDTWPGSPDYSQWQLFSSMPLSRVVLDGTYGVGTLFDRTFGGAEGTSGSASGWDFRYGDYWTATPDFWGTTAIYTNAVGIGGAAPVGDIYAMVDIRFDNVFSNIANFTMDADNTLYPQDFVPVPEPASLLLLVTGLSFVGLAARRRKE